MTALLEYFDPLQNFHVRSILHTNLKKRKLWYEISKLTAEQM